MISQLKLSLIFAAMGFGCLVASSSFAKQSPQMEVRKSEQYDPKKFAASKPAVGTEAPDLKLKTLEGETVSLSSYRGKNVVVIKAGYT